MNLPKDENISIDLTNCEQEPIRTPGSIQPHGALLVVNDSLTEVLYTSENLKDYFPGHQDIHTVSGWFGDQTTLCLKGVLPNIRATQVPSFTEDSSWVNYCYHRLICRPDRGQNDALETAIHQLDGKVYIEIEKVDDKAPVITTHLHEELIHQCRKAQNLETFLTLLAQQVKHLIGFDRVMIYRFHDDWHGEVMVDDHELGLQNFLGLHFPASDIPKQARVLYSQNPLRYIADVLYEPVAVQANGSSGPAPLDMSNCLLRSVSPIHLKYLTNMGVRSSLSLSLMVDGRLWGLVACHHHSATRLPLYIRRAAYSLSLWASTFLRNMLNTHRAEMQANRYAEEAIIRQLFSQSHLDLGSVIDESSSALLKLARASGGLFWKGDQQFPFGNWPAGKVGEALSDWIRAKLADDKEAPPAIFHTNQIGKEFTWGDRLPGVGGCAALLISPDGSAGMIWLRPEIHQEVYWGGDPNKPVEMERDDQGNLILSPRNSFEQWKESRSGLSRPWYCLDLQSIASLKFLHKSLEVRNLLDEITLSRGQIRSLLELSSDAYWQTDTHGNLIILSRSLPVSHGLELGSSLIKQLGEYCPREVLLSLDLMMEKRESFKRIRLPLTDPESQTIHEYQISGECLRDEDHTPVGYHGTLSDISKELDGEKKLKDALDSAKQANQAKSQFLANMSHEIRTPLNAIIGSAFLLEQTPLSEEQSSYVESLTVASKSLFNQINDLLDIAKIEAGESILHMAPFNVGDLFDEMGTLFSGMALNKGLRLEFSVDEATPPVIIGDAAKLTQVLTNLINNALKFTEKGEVRVTTKVARKNERRVALRFSVRDTGPGISPEELDRLFKPFQQLDDSHTRRHGGTGLGLSIVKLLSEQVSGKSGAESWPELGSLFWVEWPFDLPEAGSETKPLAVEKMDLSTPHLAGLGILVVDDSALNREVCRRILEKQGARVIESESGSHLIEELKHHSFQVDAILMDIQMPGMDGYETTQQLRKTGAFDQIPIIALTAGVLVSEREKAMSAGMNGFLTKPVQPHALVRLLLDLTASKAAGTGAMVSPHDQKSKAPAWNELPGVDREHVENLFGEDQAFYRVIVRKFCEESPQLLVEIPSDDPMALADRLHKLRGLAGNLGAMALHRHAGELEQALRAGEPLDPDRYQQLQGDHQQLLATLESFLLGGDKRL